MGGGGYIQDFVSCKMLDCQGKSLSDLFIFLFILSV